MNLTRRDALAALAAGGVAVGGGVAAHRWRSLHDDPDAPVEFGERAVETLVSLAEVVYPSAVSGIPEFVETYVVGRIRDRSSYATGVKEALETLDSYAAEWYDRPYADLDRETRDALLREMDLPYVDPDPEGTAPARVRFYLVNELLYALYTSPAGGELVGVENPQGHPGGLDSYRRGPEP